MRLVYTVVYYHASRICNESASYPFPPAATPFFCESALPLAAALDVQAGELVQWQLIARSDLRLLRLAAPAPVMKAKK